MTSTAAVSGALPREVTPAYARELTDRIKVVVQGIEDRYAEFLRLFDEAVVTEAWRHVPHAGGEGYPSIDAYCRAEFDLGRSRLYQLRLADHVKQVIADNLPENAPPVPFSDRHVRGLSNRGGRRAGEVEEVAERVRGRVMEASPEERPRLVQQAVREVVERRRERTGEVVDAVVTSVEMRPEDAARGSDITVGKGVKAPSADPQTLSRLYAALDFLAELASRVDPTDLLRAIPEGEWWQLSNLSHAARWLNELIDARDLGEQSVNGR